LDSIWESVFLYPEEEKEAWSALRLYVADKSVIL
jgi:hypothetical protein